MEKVIVDMTAKPDKWTDVTLNDGAQVKIRDLPAVCRTRGRSGRVCGEDYNRG